MISEVAVLGAGQMGSGIAHILARQELKVILFDIAEEQLDKALASIEKNLTRQAKKEELDSTTIPAGSTLRWYEGSQVSPMPIACQDGRSWICR